MQNIRCEATTQQGFEMSAEEVVRKYCESVDPKTGKPLFPTMREFVCFAALLGLSESNLRHLTGEIVTIVDGRIFEKSDRAMDIYYAVVLAHDRSTSILSDENEDLAHRLFEAYVNGGLEIVQRTMIDEPGSSSGLTYLERLAIKLADEEIIGDKRSIDVEF
ncbi:dnd system-associated protein 4 [Natronospira proteinivora]|uniref:Dnd system-associated protein 4 n=1 Tax=Natronospira proteinivora TaxID=1807133 RepID=A0ABT1G8G4_9GAMM|nr:hypothetical protein [Natronospira proteinivora]MCP1727616.1 dnd system-associated protein 4 [Natronospira proteinivora]